MKTTNKRIVRVASVSLATLAFVACGTAIELLTNGDGTESVDESSPELDLQSMLAGSLESASGMTEPQYKPFRMDGNVVHGPGGPGPGHARGPGHGHGPGHRGRGGHHPPGDAPGHDKGPHLALPAEIADLMKSADAKKDTVLGIVRSKIEPVLIAMRTDLEVLRSLALSREVFQVKAKEIQDKYAEQLKALLPTFDSLTQEQKDRVKAIHDLQKKVIEACVARGADAGGETCTSAKNELRANIDAT